MCINLLRYAIISEKGGFFVKSYQKESDYSYTLGVFPTIELLKNKVAYVEKVILHSLAYKNSGIPVIETLCEENNIPIEISDKTINKLSKKGNCYAIGVFKKYPMHLQETNHVLLVNPSDMGNMGTIIRTMQGFGYQDLGIIRPGVDVFDPKVIRASMGAIFNMNIEYFDHFEEYRKRYPHVMYPLMLKGATNIHQITPTKEHHTLIFGNESSGLPDGYLDYGQSIFIPHSSKIDSLNLSMALGITLSYFSKDQFKDMTALDFEKAIKNKD